MTVKKKRTRENRAREQKYIKRKCLKMANYKKRE
jgi:hypothetical protein